MSLHDLQTKVHVAKDKKNDFGGYNYRTAEGILAAIKAELQEGESIVCTDRLQDVAGQIFVSSTATVTFADGTFAQADGHAMHPLTKKGMDPSQITGTASSYARKYALSGLMALDDGSADPDAAKTPYAPNFSYAVDRLKEATSVEDLTERFKSLGKDARAAPEVVKAGADRKAELQSPQASHGLAETVDDNIPY